MSKAALYCRLSKEYEHSTKEGEYSESIQNQKMILTDFALKNDFEIYKIYSDENYSGLDDNRPSFNAMIQDAQRGCFDTIICKTQSRFTRDMEYVEKYIHGLFSIMGIRFIGVVDNVDTNIKGNKKTRQINGLVNEWYCEDLSENIKSVYKNKMEQGQYLGAFPPYGYLKDPYDHHKLIVDEKAAEIVKKIFQWYLKGYGVQKIRNMLYEQSVVPPSIYKKNQFNTFSHPSFQKNIAKNYDFWSTSTIKKILKNEVYIGSVVQGKERKLNYKSKKVVAVPKSQWIVVKNMHEAIIDKYDFDLVQKMQKQNRYETKNKTNIEKNIYLFSGKVFCKYCKNRMFRVLGRNGTSYLYCQVFSRSKGKQCQHNSIREDKLEQFVKQKINIFISQNDFYKKIKNETTHLNHEILNCFIDYIEIAYGQNKNNIIIHWNI